MGAADACTTQAEQAQAPTGLRGFLASLPLVPLPFLGMSVWRAWLVVVCDGGLTAGSGWEHAFGGFDVVIILTMLLCVRFARALTPIWRHLWVRAAAVALTVAASLLGYAFMSVETPGPVLGIAFNTLVGVGTALTTLLWLEAYSSIGPTRACLCYAVMIAVGGLIGLLFRSFDPHALPLAAALLPLISMRCLWNCYRSQGAAARVPTPWASFSFPWKPMLVIAVYAFAYGLLQSSIYEVSTRSASVSTILCAAAVALLVLLTRERFAFSSLYSWLLPLVIAVTLVLAALMGANVWWANFFANLALTTSSLFITTMLCSLSYHWGVSAVWLFGIEEIANLAAMLAGRAASGVMASAGLPPAPLLVVAVLAATALALRESRITSSWGVRIAGEQADPEAAREAAERASLTGACAALARTGGLSQREEHVLRILAQRGTARDIERELGVANGTAKAHIRHVYQKLDIHTREELFALVDEARG